MNEFSPTYIEPEPEPEPGTYPEPENKPRNPLEPLIGQTISGRKFNIMFDSMPLVMLVDDKPRDKPHEITYGSIRVIALSQYDPESDPMKHWAHQIFVDDHTQVHIEKEYLLCDKVRMTGKRSRKELIDDLVKDYTRSSICARRLIEWNKDLLQFVEPVLARLYGLHFIHNLLVIEPVTQNPMALKYVASPRTEDLVAFSLFRS